MKCSIPEISWHNREPVLSVDIQPINPTNNDFYRLATGGSDNLVLIWKLINGEDGRIDVTVLSELTRHQRSVNVVKWSPNGEMLASGDDDSNIILWQLKTDNIPSLDDHENDFEERWNVYKVLRGHKEDVYDICWSPKCDKLLSGSVDNSAILWDVVKGKSEHIITDHKGFVQGVAWDPKGQYLATLSSDRICRLFVENGRRVRARIGRGTLPVAETDELYEKEVKFFHDDTFKTYFRRLCFTPDGSMLLVPSGAVETNDRKNVLFGTFAFTLDSFSSPVCLLPSAKQCSIVVKCCPILFELREAGPKPIVDLAYRMIIAVATDSDVILYDTQQHAPCVHLQNIHYTRLTDLTWSPDGLLLAASSTDGFITLVTFEHGELGTPYIKEDSDVEENVLNISGCEELPQDVPEAEPLPVPVPKVEIPKVEKPRKPSFLEQWAKQAPNATKRKINEVNVETMENKKVKNEDTKVIEIQDSPVKNDVTMEQIEPEEKDSVLTQVVNTPDVKKKRITPILVSSPKIDVKVEPVSAPREISNQKAKRRIQPVKVGEIAKISTNQQNCEKKDIDKTEMKQVAVVITKADQESANAKVFEMIQNGDKSDVKTKDEVKMPAPMMKESSLTLELKNTNKEQDGVVVHMNTGTNTTPKTGFKKTPKQKQKVSPSNKTKTVSTPDNSSSSSKKKKAPTPSQNTLLNYLKPIGVKTPTSTHSNETVQKSEFKPLNLFAVAKSEKTQPNDEIKIKCNSLFKPKSNKVCNIQPGTASMSVVTVTEDTTEVPDDFVLAVEDSDSSMNITVEKENSDDKECGDTDKIDKTIKNIKDEDMGDMKQPRRIPLITLSSPKNKKKMAE